jgi:type III pantothenate kinase
MNPDLVVDIGNTRMKWGWLDAHGTMHVSRLAHGEPEAWDAELERLNFHANVQWAVASVHPTRLGEFLDWCKDRGDGAINLQSRHDLPIEVAIESPDNVGLDRLLGAVAANARRRTGCPAITIDIGTAVTLNSLDERGRFVGGAILPGPRLMASALHQFTAKLPLVDTNQPTPSHPGQTTTDAIRLGIHTAIAGAIESYCVRFTSARFGREGTDYFLTGGGSPAFAMPWMHYVPTLNLEGLRIAALARRR